MLAVTLQLKVPCKHFEAGNIAEARDQLKQLQAADPANVEVLLALGQVCVADGDLDTAESCLDALPDDDKDGVAGRRPVSYTHLTLPTICSV